MVDVVAVFYASLGFDVVLRPVVDTCILFELLGVLLNGGFDTGADLKLPFSCGGGL